MRELNQCFLFKLNVCVFSARGGGQLLLLESVLDYRQPPLVRLESLFSLLGPFLRKLCLIRWCCLFECRRCNWDATAVESGLSWQHVQRIKWLWDWRLGFKEVANHQRAQSCRKECFIGSTVECAQFMKGCVRRSCALQYGIEFHELDCPGSPLPCYPFTSMIRQHDLVSLVKWQLWCSTEVDSLSLKWRPDRLRPVGFTWANSYWLGITFAATFMLLWGILAECRHLF